MTNKTTIASLKKDYDNLKVVVNHQMSALRYGISNALGISNDGKRDIYDIYGYPKSLGGEQGFRVMFQHANRQGIANRITYGIARPCWRDGFKVYASADDGAEELLQDQITVLTRNKLVQKLEAADVFNRVGRMSALFIGVPDGRTPDQPLGGVVNGEANLDKLYFSPYSYDGINISQTEQDTTSPRYGLPIYYSLQRIPTDGGDKDPDTKSIKAHWSRVIHLNENGLSSDIEGLGSLEPVFNRILDLDKTTGGSAEAYFRNARGKIAHEMDKEFSSDFLQNEDAKKQFQEKSEEFTNNWKDHIVAIGSKVQAVNTPHASPEHTVKSALWEIAGYTGIPIRILTGEGSGQLAGSEDQLAFNAIIKDRQSLICSHWIYRLFEILIQAGMLPKLPDSYEVRFEVQQASTDREKSENADRYAAALLKLTQAKSQPGGDEINLESAVSALGIEGIEFEEVDASEEDDLDESLQDDLD
tara:strand:+ start:364 stop:1782 length:1419 start_codon:yes stop_codon:yes gene_type:complete